MYSFSSYEGNDKGSAAGDNPYWPNKGSGKGNEERTWKKKSSFSFSFSELFSFLRFWWSFFFFFFRKILFGRGTKNRSGKNFSLIFFFFWRSFWGVFLFFFPLKRKGKWKRKELSFPLISLSLLNQKRGKEMKKKRKKRYEKIKRKIFHLPSSSPPPLSFSEKGTREKRKYTLFSLYSLNKKRRKK